MKVQMKRFLLEESARLGVCPNTVHTNIKRGNYIGMKIKRVNARVVFVVEPGKLTRKPDHPFNSRYGINWRQVGHKEGVRIWRMKTGRTTRPQIRNRTTWQPEPSKTGQSAANRQPEAKASVLRDDLQAGLRKVKTATEADDVPF